MQFDTETEVKEPEPIVERDPILRAIDQGKKACFEVTLTADGPVFKEPFDG